MNNLRLRTVCVLLVLLVLGPGLSVEAAQFTLKGSVTFEWDPLSLMKQPATGKIAFPKNTVIEVFKKVGGSFGKVADTLVTNDSGEYSLTVNGTATDEFQVRVYLRTMKDAPHSDQPRINVLGRFGIGGLGDHEWYVQTTTFTFATADATKTPPELTLNVHLGNSVTFTGSGWTAATSASWGGISGIKV